MKALAALLLAAAIPALAEPIEYTIDFNYIDSLAIDYFGGAIPGLDAPTGSFTYDPANVGSEFSNFSVTWGNAAFDLTSSANAPMLASDPITGCSSAVAGQPYGFALISQNVTGCESPWFRWSGLYYGASAGANDALGADGNLGFAELFLILGVDLPGGGVAQDEIGAYSQFAADSSVLYEQAVGVWTPEPGAISMMLLGAAVLAWMKTARAARR
jgi:hypothetical protein